MKLAFSFALAALLTGLGFGQLGGFAISSKTTLMMTPEVKKELKITKDQDKKIKEVMSSLQKPGSEFSMGSFDMSNPMGFLDEKMVPILDETQLKRLTELYLQANTGFVIMEEPYAKALGLTDQLVEELLSERKSAADEIMMQMSQVRNNGDKKKLDEKRKASAQALLGKLNKDQLALYQTMLGKPFKFKNI